MDGGLYRSRLDGSDSVPIIPRVSTFALDPRTNSIIFARDSTLMRATTLGENIETIVTLPFSISDMSLRIIVPEPSHALLASYALTGACLSRCVAALECVAQLSIHHGFLHFEYHSRTHMSFRHGWIASGLLIALAAASQADIYRWDNGKRIPGTEGIAPGPSVQLNHWNLEFADLTRKDLSGSRFDSSKLTNAFFHFANLQDTNFTNADLSGAVLSHATLANSDLTGAVVVGTSLSGTTAHGFLKEQLYSTASYQVKDLRGIGLFDNDLTGWNFRDQNLTGAVLGFLGGETLANADFRGANLTNASFAFATVTHARLQRYQRDGHDIPSPGSFRNYERAALLDCQLSVEGFAGNLAGRDGSLFHRI